WSLFRRRGFPSLKVAPDSGSFGGGLQWQSNNVLERTVRGDRARGASIAWRLYARAARESASCGRSTRRWAAVSIRWPSPNRRVVGMKIAPFPRRADVAVAAAGYQSPG